MKVVIADDEPLARSRLRRLLGEIADCECLGEASHGEALLKLVADTHPDIALVDIRMPGMDGLNAARRLGELSPPPAIIFTTAHSEHALSAFGTTASGYLLKPIKLDQLRSALLKARRPNRAQLEPGHSAAPTEDRFIEVRERDRQLRVALSEVIFCLAEDKYTRLVWDGGEHLIDISLVQLEERFPGFFLRVHRKVLVEPNRISGLEKHVSGQRLLLRGTTHKPPVSRRLGKEVRQLMKRDST